jgi:hypothetical protein
MWAPGPQPAAARSWAERVLPTPSKSPAVGAALSVMAVLSKAVERGWGRGEVRVGVAGSAVVVVLGVVAGLAVCAVADVFAVFAWAVPARPRVAPRRVAPARQAVRRARAARLRG